MSEFEKVAQIDLKEEPYLQPISNRGIGFYNLDKNTAKFQFIVSKNNKPLLISGENVKGYAFFKADNGNGGRPTTSGVLDVEYIDPMKGLIGVTVPQWFLKNVVNSQVYGEVYLSLNDVNRTGKDDTVVLGTFTFTVRDSLVNQIESDIKVSYIRMFDDLRDELEKKVEDLKNDIDSTTDLFETVKQTIENGLKSINQASTDGTTTINKSQKDALDSIDKLTTSSLSEIDAKKNDVESNFEIAQNSFKNTVNQSTKDFDSKVVDANTQIDNKVNDFKTNGALTKTDVDNVMSTYNWQKFRLTNDDGYIISIPTTIDLSTMIGLEKTGNYYLSNAINVPENRSKYCYVNVINQGTNTGYAIYREYNSNILLLNQKYAGMWKGWQRINQEYSDTGWTDLTVVNGVTPNTEYTDQNGFRCSFRVITQGTLTTNILRLNASNIVSGQVIATLPKGMVQNAQSFSVRTPVDKPGCFITIRPTGEIIFYKSNVTGDWDSKDYVYGEIRFTN